MDKRNFWVCVLFLLLIQGAMAQQVVVTGGFLEDSVRIGEEVPYSLTARYPRYIELIFPDSTYEFSPFEYMDREYFPTRSDSLTSFDSVVYYLATFEIDSVQYLQMPVFLPQEDDSMTIYASADSMILEHVIEQLPDSLDLKENTAFLEVPGNFNYPILLILLTSLLILAVLIAYFFGKRIRRWIRIWLMKRSHRKFVERFYGNLGIWKNGQAGKEPELLLSDWKKYMEKLENEPYTKLTSRELIRLHADQRLKDNLRAIDRFIYGDIKDRPLHEHFERLLEYTVERYDLKIEELRHG